MIDFVTRLSISTFLTVQLFFILVTVKMHLVISLYLESVGISQIIQFSRYGKCNSVSPFQPQVAFSTSVSICQSLSTTSACYCHSQKACWNVHLSTSVNLTINKQLFFTFTFCTVQGLMRQWQLICQSTLDKCVLIANGEIKKSRVKLLREGFKKNVKLGLLAEPPLTPPPS